ncbi:hypothetical protein S40293_01059 [Stachybotrys chartarum IBT 40293]|nr:hypothetical protein S40293_01059 [Stachybotrys chartarum IBT 40293]KFA79997.1 hypothetical protein S40288_01845 [Stachybotrys chartarum IBT 40288]
MSHQQQAGQPPYGQAPPQGGYYSQQPPPGQYQQPPPGQYQPPPPGQYQQPQPGQFQQPPPGQYQQPPPGQYQQPPPGPYQHQPPGQYGQPPAGQYQTPPPGQFQSPPPGQYQQPPPGQYPPQQWQPQQGYPGQQPQGQQPGQYYAPPGQPPHGQQPQYGYPQQYAPAVPAPASLGYDPAQKQFYKPVDTKPDVETLRNAMKGFGCDKNALIRVFTSSKYASPWAMEQLVADFNSRLMRNLIEDIKKETSGGLEDILLALIRGPLQNDVRAIAKAIDGAGTDKVALADVLLGRSNADIRAIAAEYRRVRGKDLLADIRGDISDEKMVRMYSMVLTANRQEPSAPVNPADIEAKVTELQRATEGIVGANEIAVAEILIQSNGAQLAAMAQRYQSKFHRSLEDVIEDEFRGSMEDAFLHMLGTGSDLAKADAAWLHASLVRRTGPKDKHFIYRLTTLYWDRGRMDAAKAAYERVYGKKLARVVKDALDGSYEDISMALIGEWKK